jgi:polar amino acid transport system substrate-binding protein
MTTHLALPDLLGLCLLAGLSVFPARAAHAGETLDRVRRTGVMVDVVNPSYPPFSFLNDHNQMDGFDIDVGRAVASRVGVRLKVETPSWEILTAGHWRGRFDVCIGSLTPDVQKAQVLQFVAPYYDAPAVLVTTAQNTGLLSARELAGRHVGVEQGSSYERYLQKKLVIPTPDGKPLSFPFEDLRIAPYGSEDLAFQDLALGAGKRIDAVVSNAITARMRMARMPGRFRIVGTPLYQEPNWVATDRGDPEWDALLARTIAGMARDGTLAGLSHKWLGEDVTRH